MFLKAGLLLLCTVTSGEAMSVLIAWFLLNCSLLGRT